MTDQAAANVLTEDGPVPEVEQPEIAAEESLDAEPKGGEGEPQADAELGDEVEHKKRLGGWQRKILKEKQEKEFWRDEALRNRSEKTEKPAPEAASDEPQLEIPDLETFPGTVQEFKAAVQAAKDDWKGKLKAWTEKTVVNVELNKRRDARLATVREAIGKMPEFDDMQKAVSEANLPDRLINLIQQEAGRFKHGPDVVRALLLDPDEVSSLALMDEDEDVFSIKARFHAVAQALRIAGKKSEPVVVEEEPDKKPLVPTPINPVKKVAPSGMSWLNDPNMSNEEWARRRDKAESGR